VSKSSSKFFSLDFLSSLNWDKKILIKELTKVELLIVLAEELPKKVSVLKIFFEVVDPFSELDLFVEPVQYYLAHFPYSNLYNLWKVYSFVDKFIHFY